MVSKAWRVRFAPAAQPQPSIPPDKAPKPKPTSTSISTSTPTDLDPPRRRQPKSKYACQECRLRRVKCDEAFPVCRRCQRRGSVCIPAPRKTIWRPELPFLIQYQHASSTTETTEATATPSALLQYWLERVCHIMVVDPDVNPWALPLLALLKESAALLHAVQSVAAAYKGGFCGEVVGESECLVERQMTLSSIQRELSLPLSQTNRHPVRHPVSTFLAIFLLGISSPWIEGTTGSEHLMGARAVLDIVLQDPASDPSSPTVQLIVGLYVWWEMAASFSILDRHLHKPLNTSVIHDAVIASRLEYHPLAGYSLEIFYLLANLNHYCRRIMDGEDRDLALEETLEEQMMTWAPSRENEQLFLVSDSYRKHGLIQLRRICGPGQDQTEQENERLIEGWAAEAMANLQRVPITSPLLNIQPIPLLSAASEIPAHDVVNRDEVRARFRAIHSLNRLPVMLDAITLLEEIWELRPLGITASWVMIIHERGQLFPLA